MIFEDSAPEKKELKKTAYLDEEHEHGEREAGDRADEYAADGAQADALGVVQDRAVVLEVGRPVAG